MNAFIITLAETGSNGMDTSGFRNTTAQLLIMIFVFVAVFYVIYIIYKYFLPGGKRGPGFVFGKSKHMRVLEITSVGPGSTIQLVKVSEEYFLIGVTKTHITFMTKLDAESISTAAYDEPDITQKPRFIELLGNIAKKPKD
ncbi:MAG: flagellar biosynthetic protein FliO [Defluviitaleaceae bacterium]|nr:flagellar biosynthetic protein FliO [Defluviitaleaceae bacterium]MCL2835854.1 flagellar biosynthetic protein FliO [Defluviitaleaceae bacterium]